MAKGKLIVVEGSCDGIGKSTQVNKLRERLINDGNELIHHHFPSYGTQNGALVEEYLKGKYGKPADLSPYFVNSLYAIDRAIVWQTILSKSYEEGKVILLDRYTTSSIIYQSSLITDPVLKKEFIKYVIDYEYTKLGIKEPDKVIFLTAPFDVVAEQRRNRKENEGIINDIHEADIEFMKKVYDSSLFVADMLSWDVVECSESGKMRSIEDIHEDIYTRVRK